MVAALVSRSLVYEIGQYSTDTFRGYFTDMWNLLDATTVILTAIVIGFILGHHDAAVTTELAVINTMLMWFRALRILSGWDSAFTSSTTSDLLARMKLTSLVAAQGRRNMFRCSLRSSVTWSAL